MSKEKEFEEFFHRYYTPLGMYVMRICGDANEAEDIVQETFSVAWQKFAKENLPKYFKSYLYTTAHNITIDRLRQKNHEKGGIPLDEVDELELTEESIDTSERDARLWIAISELPERCRKIFLMAKRDGMSRAEIAEELEISVKTVDNQMTKAFKSLRDSLEPSKGKVFFLPFL